MLAYIYIYTYIYIYRYLIANNAGIYIYISIFGIQQCWHIYIYIYRYLVANNAGICKYIYIYNKKLIANNAGISIIHIFFLFCYMAVKQYSNCIVLTQIEERNTCIAFVLEQNIFEQQLNTT